VEGASLSEANLEGANGSNALTGAETGADEAPNEELADEAKSLKGATMPNGQKYEDWLKDKEGAGEDE
jgi:uncharacterized protein YjbI with pentapeptide repeats